MSAVLIVGANGKLGKEITRRLSANYYTIGTSRGSQTDCEQTIFVKDLFQETENIVRVVKEILAQKELRLQMIIYVAGFGYNEKKLTSYIQKEMYQVNCYATQQIAKEFSTTKFVYISSCAVLGITGTRLLETYSLTKRKAEASLKEICCNLTLVRPTIVSDTDFMKTADLPPIPMKGFMNSTEVAQYIVDNLDQKMILPGWQAKALHIFHRISPKLAQKFLKT